MNDEQKSRLLRMLDGLVAEEAAVIHARRGGTDLADAIDAREALVDRVVDFAESLGEPIAAIPGDPDPRAGLRRCAMWSYDDAEPTSRLGYFIGPTSAGAFVEYEDGTVEIVSAGCFHFIDIPESEDAQCSG